MLNRLTEGSSQEQRCNNTSIDESLHCVPPEILTIPLHEHKGSFDCCSSYYTPTKGPERRSSDYRCYQAHHWCPLIQACSSPAGLALAGIQQTVIHLTGEPFGVPAKHDSTQPAMVLQQLSDETNFSMSRNAVPGDMRGPADDKAAISSLENAGG